MGSSSLALLTVLVLLGTIPTLRLLIIASTQLFQTEEQISRDQHERDQFSPPAKLQNSQLKGDGGSSLLDHFQTSQESWKGVTTSEQKNASSTTVKPRRSKSIARQPRRLANATLESPCGQVLTDTANSKRDSCGGYKFPLSPESLPAQCWPRVVLLPSYPTSGNNLVSHMFESLTGLVSFECYHLRGPLAFVTTTTEKDRNFSLYYNNGLVCPPLPDSLAVPYSGRVALTKTHSRGGDPSIASTDAQKEGTVGGGITAVVRLARNPGDHVLRDSFRWQHRDCRHDACFFQNASEYCPKLASKARSWNRFHASWNKYDPSVPQMILHYEHAATASVGPEAYRGLLEFVNETESDPGTLEVKVKAGIREPTYQQGALVAQVCGVEVARAVHAVTQEQSKLLGYDFNQTSGVWSLFNELASQS